MPWKSSDADSHRKGLNPAQKKKWCDIANGVLADCMKKGGNDATCAPKAIRIANSKFDEPKGKTLMNCPSNAFMFEEKDNTIQFTESDGVPRMKMTGYSGGMIKDHFFWGNLVIDLSGMQFDKKKIQICSYIEENLL